MGIFDGIRALLSSRAGAEGGTAAQSDADADRDLLPMRGGLLLDGLLWVGILEPESGDGHPTHEVTVEGPRCPECGTDVRRQSVSVLDAVPPVDGREGEALYRSLPTAPDRLPFPELPMERYVADYFDGEPQIRLPHCPLCQYTTLAPLLSDRTYRWSADGETEAEPALAEEVIPDLLERELQQALESAGTSTDDDSRAVWDQYRSDHPSGGPYELVDPSGDATAATPEAGESHQSAIESLAAEATTAVDSERRTLQGDDPPLPDDAGERMAALAAWVAAVSTDVDELYDAPLDAERRAQLEAEVDCLRTELEALDATPTETGATGHLTYLVGLIEARARLAAIDRLLTFRDELAGFLTGAGGDSTSPTGVGLEVAVARLDSWLTQYGETQLDFLTVEEALTQFETAHAYAEAVRERLDNNRAFLGASLTETLEDARHQLEQVITFIEQRDTYNESWVATMRGRYKTELDSFFDDPAAEHNDKQLRAVFRNDNYNRVNAAAGTGKTTTLGRRVHFLTTEYDAVAPSDILAITFTRTGVREMETELEETFGITGVAVRTLNSYAKEVAEAQVPGLHMLTDEARLTELADIWDDVITSKDHHEQYTTFLEQWKAENYTPENEDERASLCRRLDAGDSVTIQGEEISTQEATEERLAHQAIAKWLTRASLEYDYKRYADWAALANDTAYIADFQVETPAETPDVFIEYWPTQAARDDWPGYKAAAEPAPRTIRNLFDTEVHGEAVAETAVSIIEGAELLPADARTATWDEDQFRQYFSQHVPDRLDEQFRRVLGDDAETLLEPRLSQTELEEFVYETYECDRRVLEKVEEFIQQARVREWDPAEAEQQVVAYCTEQTVEPAVEAFCQLCLSAYERFADRFDNETLTDFHGTQVITRDRLQAGEVGEKYLYEHVLVDEMQDLNKVQFDMVRELSDARPDTRVFGVGDDWQSIFGFRGARPDLFIRFGEQLGAGAAPNVDFDAADVFRSGDDTAQEQAGFADTRIEENHRCSRPVVAASNEVITNNEVRTEKEPWTTSDGPALTIHHVACDTFGTRLNTSMRRKVLSLIDSSAADPADIRVIVRQRDGDSAFFYPLAEAVPDGVTVQTAHDSKGTEAEHVIIPKVMSSGGYPSIRTDQWVRPIKQPPAIYEEKGTDYQLEEERRMFYVALTRAERRVDLLTVDGAESRFLDELPDETCSHVRPFSEDERAQLAAGDLRKNMRGQVVSKQTNGQFVHFDWVDGGILDVNLYDATADQIAHLESLATADRDVLLQNCGLEYRPSPTDDRGETERVQIQVDAQTSIEPVD